MALMGGGPSRTRELWRCCLVSLLTTGLRPHLMLHLLLAGAPDVVNTGTHMELLVFGYSFDRIVTIQRKLAWPVRKDDTHKLRRVHCFSSSCSCLRALRSCAVVAFGAVFGFASAWATYMRAYRGVVLGGWVAGWGGWVPAARPASTRTVWNKAGLDSSHGVPGRMCAHGDALSVVVPAHRARPPSSAGA